MLKKTLFPALVIGAVLAFSPVSSITATAFKGPATKVQSESLVELAKGKKKAKKGKKARSKAGKCGAYMYWSKKEKKCLDARNKK